MLLEVSKGPQMINSTINTIVLIIFGFLIGAMFTFSGILMQKERFEVRKLEKGRRAGLTFSMAIKILLKTLPLYGLIAVFILILKNTLFMSKYWMLTNN